MQVSVLKENLSKALNTVGRIVSTKGSLPVLSHVLINTEDGRLKLSSTNLELGITYKIGGKVEKNGSITVPSRLFTDFVNSLPNEKIDLTLKELTLKAKCSNYNSEIKGLSSDEFPLIPNVKENKVLSIDSKTLKEAIRLVSFAAAVDDARPVLSGVYFSKEGKRLTLVATDSYRLAEKAVTLTKDSKTDFSIIIPVKTIQELFKIISDLEGEVEVYLSDNQILFEIDGVELMSRLIEGQFPNYKQIIPDSSETKATVNSAEFVNALKVTILFAKENANTINVQINPKGKIELQVEANQIGSSDSFVEADVEGKGGEISFNGRFLADALQNISSKDVTLEISSKLTPGIVRAKEIKDYTYIIMPLRS
ncbi:MAG: polymerase III subunit beta protein [candidate division CPR2 bacterium GW2011_GWC1_41_48]|uniref:Beta sliding clamp n=1 Tax=candidate division CPR2 bacterium GW2011_GWC1_41_48 TaxID=1618344 RepID=A0A0G0Z8P7_UNCC2|nr:MAG: polymerase III subunit beta protein [candidate division CPR2 bacterium GW2011_GWC2_39_35]KKR27963.1 MAG: polymerase III subunit beta protein [candidate division CPR2 bacterium GW2011_GWD2_39_7]KKS09423.1 MAG: polymerase III subunit beta protein [candidate division CPR2 bacterium GW2011_GWC1_41_48]OGB72073.1 MAG: DNA polymerase III subunit beta [candidate division CPR2 bacterium GWD2_39_7]